MDPKHNPEFTTVELYQAYADFHDMMDLFEALLSGAAKEILGTYQMHWMGEDVDLTPGWPRMTMAEAVRKYLGVDFMSVTTDAEAEALAASVGVELGPEKDHTWGNFLYECFDQKVEGEAGAAHLYHHAPCGCVAFGEAVPQGPQTDRAL